MVFGAGPIGLVLLVLAARAHVVDERLGLAFVGVERLAVGQRNQLILVECLVPTAALHRVVFVDADVREELVDLPFLVFLVKLGEHRVLLVADVDAGLLRKGAHKLFAGVALGIGRSGVQRRGEHTLAFAPQQAVVL